MEHPLYFSEPFTKMQAWVDLLLIANHKEKIINVRGNLVTVGRGQVGWSEESLGERWKWSRGKVRRYISYLISVHQVEQQKSKVLSLITIINYERYQENGTTDDTSDSTTDGRQTVQQTDTNNNVNNENNIPNGDAQSAPDDFLENSEGEEKKEEENGRERKDLSAILTNLKQWARVEDFKENQEQQRIWAQNFHWLISGTKKRAPIPADEIRRRIVVICKDEFKFQHRNSIRFLYSEVKAFAGSKPSVPKPPPAEPPKDSSPEAIARRKAVVEATRAAAQKMAMPPA